ncbi:scaffold protein [Pseudomonas putida TRO1]|uniref:Scaffold protein n=1 Tax=Pseudomonas putida TRO1 TaxID=1227924 RepID=A0AAD2WAC2_PSEPU|nr:GPO family capsid scaffolding protein [Pseudomonas putida]ELS0924221.1 GPO family capsid scaffolding protein [Pseudomonas putida]ENY76600.1 scaffold protein [Pseudomonas putida TRO1]
MPRSLVSYWKRVATSGPTIDGREILPQELRDAAETYKTATYTAVIWCEHERWSGSFGTVYSLRLVEDAEDLQPGQVALEAQLKPNDKLLFLNDQGEKLFTSVEITPNFANTGKYYLTGMAVTDSPASLGTQELYFSSRTSKAAHFCAPVELGPLDKAGTESEIGKLAALMTKFFKRFATEPAGAAPSDNPTESKPPMDEATATALGALLQQLLIVAAGIQAVIEPAAEDAPAPDQEPIETVETAVDDIVATAEEQREFSRRRPKVAPKAPPAAPQQQTNQALAQSMANIENMFSQLVNNPQGRPIPRTTGVTAEKPKRVL